MNDYYSRERSCLLVYWMWTQWQVQLCHNVTTREKLGWAEAESRERLLFTEYNSSTLQSNSNCHRIDSCSRLLAQGHQARMFVLCSDIHHWNQIKQLLSDCNIWHLYTISEQMISLISFQQSSIYCILLSSEESRIDGKIHCPKHASKFGKKMSSNADTQPFCLLHLFLSSSTYYLTLALVHPCSKTLAI